MLKLSICGFSLFWIPFCLNLNHYILLRSSSGPPGPWLRTTTLKEWITQKWNCHLMSQYFEYIFYLVLDYLASKSYRLTIVILLFFKSMKAHGHCMYDSNFCVLQKTQVNTLKMACGWINNANSFLGWTTPLLLLLYFDYIEYSMFSKWPLNFVHHTNKH